MYEVIYNYHRASGYYTKHYATLSVAIRKAKSFVKYIGSTAAIQCPNGSGILVTPFGSDQGFIVRGTAVMESI